MGRRKTWFPLRAYALNLPDILGKMDTLVISPYSVMLRQVLTVTVCPENVISYTHNVLKDYYILIYLHIQ